MSTSLFMRSRTEPARVIVGAVAIITLLAGLFIFTPWFGPSEGTPLLGGVISSYGRYTSGVVNCLVCLPAGYAVWKNSVKWLAWGSFTLALWYFFVSTSRAFLIEYPGRLLWVPALIISIVMAVTYLEQSFVRRTTEDEPK